MGPFVSVQEKKLCPKNVAFIIGSSMTTVSGTVSLMRRLELLFHESNATGIINQVLLK